MKTKKQWLGELPDGYKELALSNLDTKSSSIRKKNMHEAIVAAFVWYETKQGHDFWEQVCKHYKLGTPLPPLPTIENKGGENES